MDTKAKWDKIYSGSFSEQENEYKRLYLNDTLRQVLKHAQGKTYLEIGCGQGFLGEELAKRGWLFIGVDFSMNALKALKKRLNKRGIKNYFLILADIQSLPLKDNSVDLIYGGGVIEHLENTQIALNHIFRVLVKGGSAFNTVPLFNIGNLFYRSLWGGIPNVIILKQLVELVHLKILKGKRMIFGYELQFTESQLRKTHKKAGFKRIVIDRFDCFIQLHWIKNPRLKRFLNNLCRTNRNFWPMIKVIGLK